MNLFINILLSSIIQIVFIGIIPFIWWLVTKRKQESFFNWIGLKKIKTEQLKQIIRKTLIVIIAFLLLSTYMIFITKDISTATSQFKALGLNGLMSAIIYSFVQTSFTEEIFFRGFILKRLKNKFGFAIANIIQSILFALLHCAMFFTLTSIWNVVLKQKGTHPNCILKTFFA